LKVRRKKGKERKLFRHNLKANIMSSFHKPKLFRSGSGCCICKAKSSSSRFTDSSRYEEDFQKCFRLQEERFGEICNACVLLVKRWRKLPKNNKRDWVHVVDARAGPGGKIPAKKKVDKPEEFHKIVKKHKYRKFVIKRNLLSVTTPSRSKVSARTPKRIYKTPSRTPSRTSSVTPPKVAIGTPRRTPTRTPRRLQTESPPRSLTPMSDTSFSSDAWGFNSKKRIKENEISDFFCPSYWTRQLLCCGVIYQGLMGEVMINPKEYTRCSLKVHRRIDSKSPNVSVANLIESELKKITEIIHDERNMPEHSKMEIEKSEAENDEGFCDKASTITDPSSPESCRMGMEEL